MASRHLRFPEAFDDAWTGAAPEVAAPQPKREG